MKSYKYSTKERAERVSKTLGCTGYHYHNENGERKYMPCKDMKTFKEKTQKKSNSKEEEVTELVNDDGTWLTSDIRIMDPASTGVGTKTTDQIVAQTKTPRDVFMRGGVTMMRSESVMAEEDMEHAFGFDDTRFMDYKKTVKYYQKELGLDKDSAEERTIKQGKKPNLQKRTPKKIKQKKNFIDRLILKEKGLDENDDLIEDILINKSNYDKDINVKPNKVLLNNISSLKRMAKKQGLNLDKLIELIKNE
jgi:hypothetical protein